MTYNAPAMGAEAHAPPGHRARARLIGVARSPDLWVCLALTAAAAVMRGLRLGEPSFWLDETSTAEAVVDFKTALSQRFHPPFYHVLLWTWSKVFGAGEGGLRSLSAVAGAGVRTKSIQSSEINRSPPHMPPSR